MLSAGDTAMKKQTQNHCLYGVYVLVGETDGVSTAEDNKAEIEKYHCWRHVW